MVIIIAINYFHDGIPVNKNIAMQNDLVAYVKRFVCCNPYVLMHYVQFPNGMCIATTMIVVDLSCWYMPHFDRKLLRQCKFSLEKAL